MRRTMTLRDVFPMAWLSALTLNACLLLLAVSGAMVYAAAVRPDVYGYDPTQSALSATRRSIEDLARAIPPGEVDRASYWNRLILAELDAADLSAARGFLVAGRAMLPAREAARLEAKLPASPDNAAIAAAALSFVEPDIRIRFDGAPLAPTPGAGLIIGAPDDFEQRVRLLDDSRVDALDLTLQGLALAMREDLETPFVAGASVLIAARRAGALSPGVLAHYRTLADAALPRAHLLAAAEAAPPIRGEALTGDPVLLETLQRGVDAEGYATLKRALSDLADIAALASPTGAVRLIGLAVAPQDIARLRLIALASGEMGVAVAKRAPASDVLAAAAGTWRLSARDWAALGAAAFAAFGIVIATISGVGQAIAEALARRRKRKDDLEAAENLVAEERQQR